MKRSFFFFFFFENFFGPCVFYPLSFWASEEWIFLLSRHTSRQRLAVLFPAHVSDLRRPLSTIILSLKNSLSGTIHEFLLQVMGEN